MDISGFHGHEIEHVKPEGSFSIEVRLMQDQEFDRDSLTFSVSEHSAVYLAQKLLEAACSRYAKFPECNDEVRQEWNKRLDEVVAAVKKWPMKGE